MWFLHLLPDSFLAFIVNAVLLAGIVGTVLFCFLLNPILRFFPPLASYYKILQIGSVVVLLTGVYFKGGYSTEMLWREKVAEMEVKVKAAEAASKETNVVIKEKVIKKLELVRIPGSEIVKYVDREVTKYDNTCPVPAPVVKAHNAAALNKPVEETK
jgi:hypothetical protein